MIIGASEIQTLAELFRLCRENQVGEFKVGDLAIKMMAGSTIVTDGVWGKTIDPAAGLKDPLQNPLSPDEVLFWSAGGAEHKDTNGDEVPVPLVGEEQPE